MLYWVQCQQRHESARGLVANTVLRGARHFVGIHCSHRSGGTCCFRGAGCAWRLTRDLLPAIRIDSARLQRNGCTQAAFRCASIAIRVATGVTIFIWPWLGFATNSTLTKPSLCSIATSLDTALAARRDADASSLIERWRFTARRSSSKRLGVSCVTNFSISMLMRKAHAVARRLARPARGQPRGCAARVRAAPCCR